MAEPAHVHPLPVSTATVLESAPHVSARGMVRIVLLGATIVIPAYTPHHGLNDGE